ncbi:polysaccharide deacetylase [Helicobacter didelphidarum]|uniref:Polysaccharide deacetylase n=2 Tax=Helicobacter didelphidarum TaxID=2040648 RepID=A0A3D8IIF8_9HELI|nr:polysaccharide deacetylase [Helicobacter didelphidarum]
MIFCIYYFYKNPDILRQYATKTQNNAKDSSLIKRNSSEIINEQSKKIQNPPHLKDISNTIENIDSKNWESQKNLYLLDEALSSEATTNAQEQFLRGELLDNTLKDIQEKNIVKNLVDAESQNLLLLGLENKYQNIQPKIWQENPQGSINTIQTNKKILYLTLDACGGAYDKELIDFLVESHIHATLFINAHWIESHKEEFLELANNPFFSIQNHGTKHKPLSVNGKSIYGIQGTDSVAEVFHEIYDNEKLIFNLTGKKPTFFRSGTAYYDDIALAIAQDMGYKIGGFDIIGDGGGTFSYNKILQQAKKVRSGSILIYHFNKPKGDTRKALQTLIPQWLEQGYEFGLL